MLNVILRVMRGSWFNRLLSTVMIRFSARGAYLLLVPHEARLLETGRLFRFSETTECSKQNLKIYLERDNSRNCNSNKYTVNV